MDKREARSIVSKRFIRHPKHTYLYQDAKFGTWYFVDYADGKRVKRSLRTKSVSEAVKLSKKVRIEILNQAPIDKKLSLKGIKNPAIEDLYEAFKQFKIDSGKLKPQSLVRIYNTWDYHLKDYWGAKTLADWTQDEMLRFESWYLAERTTKYFNIKKTITSFQRWMFEKRIHPKTFNTLRPR